MVTNNIIQKKKTIKILSSLIVVLFLSIVVSQSSFAASDSQNSAIGFQDGLKDCRSGTSNAINGHSNTGHHSASYMQGYNQGLTNCNKSGGNAGPGPSTGGNVGNAGPGPSTGGFNWTLTIKLNQTQFGTSSATVDVQGPFGYKDNQTIPTGPSPSVIFTIPDNAVPDGYNFHVCVSSNTVPPVIHNCPVFTHTTGNETVTANIPG
ncbi:MAG: hypothetical protein M3Z01_07515 [Thermoproteota archaeon]|nr:hypothetical protein [Thermoproteota archaeon]